MRFKLNKIATAVAVTLGTSAVAVSTVQADEILFPYVVASPTVTTLISTINYADIDFGFGGGLVAPEKLHYKYWYKNGDDAEDNTATCAEVNKSLPSSANDVVTFDAGGLFADDNLNILFEKAADAQNVNYGTGTFALLKGVTKPVRAFLIVDNNEFVNFNQTFYRTSDSLSGEAIVLEFQSGAAWGYAAYNAAGRYNAPDGFRYNWFDFSDYVETAGEVISGRSGEGFVPVVLHPFTATGGQWLTKFFVTPIRPTTFDPVSGLWFPPPASFKEGGQSVGTLNARVRLATEDVDVGTAAIYDRDEGPVSGQAPKNVVCVGAVEAASMLTEGALALAPQGGWSNLVVSTGTLEDVIPTNEAVVIKLEYNPTPLPALQASPAVGGIVNNAIWLRKGIRESVPTPANGALPRLQIFTDGLDINATSAPSF